MQDNKARKSGADRDRDNRPSDREINERLVELLKANAVKAGQTGAERAGARRSGFFREASALLGLVGLMVVAYFYSLLVNTEA
jgi:hypothetical protein